MTVPIEVVLVRPARPANVAAACRAMKNMGIGSLWLVEAGPGLERPEARALAYGALDVLDRARHVRRLEQALAGSTFVAGTTGRGSASCWSPRRLAQQAADLAGDGALSVVFGPEASGLRNDELALCHVLVHIPTDRAQPSLNLAQAVLILAYELRLMAASGAAAPDAPAERASAGEMERALSLLEEGLLGIGYLDPRSPGPILAELRRMLARAGPTPREASLLCGMGRQIGWAASQIAEDRARRPLDRGAPAARGRVGRGNGPDRDA